MVESGTVASFKEIYRKHPAELLMPILAVSVMLIVGLLAPVIVFWLGATLNTVTLGWVALFEGLYVSLLVDLFFFVWLLWHLDAWLLTSHSLVDAELESLFHYHLAELPLEQVQDVSIDQHGLLQSIFNYGDIRVQSAGKEGLFLLRAIKNPQEVRDEIVKLVEELKIKIAAGGEEPQERVIDEG
jgi:uncharacterized membrane protein YdbT with pleckstrin-like domain